MRILKRNFRTASQEEYELFEDTSFLSVVSSINELNFDDFDGSSDIWTMDRLNSTNRHVRIDLIDLNLSDSFKILLVLVRSEIIGPNVIIRIQSFTFGWTITILVRRSLIQTVV